MALRPFTVVSTFAGCGGSSLGYKMAGGKVLLACEWDKNAVETYQLNNPETDVFYGDVAMLSVDDVLRRTGIAIGSLDVFDGSPPCQGFSTAGKRQIDDPRNNLFREYVRLLRGLQPRAFVMENVSGMVKGHMRTLFAEILRELKSCGYKVRARLLNAAWYGVPQSRERVIFIGAREDLGVDPDHPMPNVARATTVREALALPQGSRLLHLTSSGAYDFTDRAGPTFTVGHGNHTHYVVESHPHPPQLTPKYRLLAPRIKPGECEADYDPAGNGFQNLNRLRWNKPSPTLTKMNPGNGRGTLLHPELHRSLTIEEALRLSSFPDDFKMIGSFADRWSRIGNSVPPLLMCAIAGKVRDQILNDSPLV